MTKQQEPHGGWLAGISQAIKESGEQREAERLELNRRRGEPAFFIAQEWHAAGHGIGYWMLPEHNCFVGIRKHNNGYETYPCEQIDFDLVRRLHALLPTGSEG